MESACPQCGSKAYKRNGYTRHGKQNHRCLDCGRQFSDYIIQISVVHNPKEFIEAALQDNCSIKNICQ